MTDQPQPNGGLTETVIRALITIGIVVALVFVVLWFLQGVLGLVLPLMAIRIMWGNVVLVILLILLRIFRPWLGGWLP